MKPQPLPPDTSADEQASLWASRLDNAELGAADQAELEAWLAGDASRHALLEQYCQLSAGLHASVPSLFAAGRVELPPLAAPARRSGWKYAFAGALGAAAVAVAVAWFGGFGSRSQTFETTRAHRGTAILADGTRVELSANTRLVVENGWAERRVRLATGEAFFEVSKDKSRPFIVETPGGSVRVTGTRFDVLTDAASELDVTVVEGSVQVRPGETSGYQAPDPEILGPGDQLLAGNSGVKRRTLSAGAIEDALAWREGMVVFDGEPLRDALALISRYHGKTITATPGAAAVSLGTRMRLDDLDGFFADLETMHPEVRVDRDASGGARVSLRSEK
jgi:transmembrane sensor